MEMAKRLLPNDWAPLYSVYFQDTVVQWREAAILLLTFHSMARFSDVQKLTTRNLHFEEGGVTIRFGELKNNKKGAFQSGLIQENQEGFCMVSFLRRYLKRLQQAEEHAGVGVNLPAQPK